MNEMSIMGTEAQLKIALKDVPSAQIPDGIKGGDTKIIWSAENADEAAQARKTFDDLRKKGFAGFAVNKKGDKGEQIFTFDPGAEKLILVPPLRGGV